MKMQICRKHLLILSVLLLLGAGGMMAQQRLNDKDAEETMKSLEVGGTTPDPPLLPPLKGLPAIGMVETAN